MGLFNINYLQKELADIIPGGKTTLYNKVHLLMSGFRGKATKKDIQHLRRILKREYVDVDKRLNEIENED